MNRAILWLLNVNDFFYKYFDREKNQGSLRAGMIKNFSKK